MLRNTTGLYRHHTHARHIKAKEVDLNTLTFLDGTTLQSANDLQIAVAGEPQPNVENVVTWNVKNEEIEVSISNYDVAQYLNHIIASRGEYVPKALDVNQAITDEPPLGIVKKTTLTITIDNVSNSYDEATISTLAPEPMNSLKIISFTGTVEFEHGAPVFNAQGITLPKLDTYVFQTTDVRTVKSYAPVYTQGSDGAKVAGNKVFLDSANVVVPQHKVNDYIFVPREPKNFQQYVNILPQPWVSAQENEFDVTTGTTDHEITVNGVTLTYWRIQWLGTKRRAVDVRITF